MQFFYLFSFVVAASYAAALPQPAELSEKHSSNVDTTLASGLEARSYQPGLNSYKDSPTLISLERRDDSEGSSGEDSGSDSSPPPDTTPNDSEGLSKEDRESDPFVPSDTTPKNGVGLPFVRSDGISRNLAATIDKVGDDAYLFFQQGELAGLKFSDTVGDMMASYFRRSSYVAAALTFWKQNSVLSIIAFIRSNLGEDEYFKIKPHLPNIVQGLEDESHAGYTTIGDTTSRILGDNGSVTENFQNINRSFRRTFDSRWELLGVLRLQLNRFKAGNTLEVQLGGVAASLYRFYIKQQELFGKIMKKLKAKYP
ncbi:hypothetical protein BASA50_002409 [Batrachochytrium salamandrivorans]|uniref:Uncharacterized protein n=1 Tax=Batrachochytrium salamandrivorans TaxID=1357716 RepID=A0ABQ8FLG4_9FUNG|nr:hypothetical protein BASA60_007328 [Batrachochytrium salamandrivorans]KAH6590590.1 hypothetical protein BASA61_005219 [Batrachochytrium salamandrivorans]KAH6600286.1 hypothetical protein BASA50_002409 [Batrachochytrium salamandrivorans]KAH9249329.1 hypothetical protein BASA81_012947 [Batrachochytrium salamandrivorans]KAH9271116.1 hypothetical protein BASA83_006658 [Batrachochytrium salamandrivorans]